MAFEIFTKQTLVNLLELIQECTECQTLEDLHSVLKKIAVFGDAEFCAYGYFPLSEGTFSDPIKTVNHSFPAEFLNRYIAEDHQRVDPVVKFLFATDCSALWEDCAARYQAKPFKDQLEMAYGMGMLYGASNGATDHCKTHMGVISLSAAKNHFNKYHLALLDIITPHYHQAYQRINSKIIHNAPTLSRREKEVLKWIVAGKTNWEISKLLHVSHNTIKFHVKNLLKKLNATNKQQVAALAIQHKLLT